MVLNLIFFFFFLASTELAIIRDSLEDHSYKSTSQFCLCTYSNYTTWNFTSPCWCNLSIYTHWFPPSHPFFPFISFFVLLPALQTELSSELQPTTDAFTIIIIIIISTRHVESVLSLQPHSLTNDQLFPSYTGKLHDSAPASLFRNSNKTNPKAFSLVSSIVHTCMWRLVLICFTQWSCESACVQNLFRLSFGHLDI